MYSLNKINEPGDNIPLFSSDRNQDRKQIEELNIIDLQPDEKHSAPATQPPALTMGAAPAGLLGPKPSRATCPHCATCVLSVTRATVTARTHMAAALCASCLCCCIPYCSTSAKNIDHYCARCSQYLGTYKK